MKMKNAYLRAALLAVVTMFVIAVSCGGGSDSTTPASQDGADVTGGNESSESDIGAVGFDQLSDRPLPDAAAPADVRPDAEDPHGQPYNRDWEHKGKRGGHPIFGEITALTDGGLTIQPKLPEFREEESDGRDGDRGHDIPAEVSLVLNGNTAFYLNGEKQERNPFGVGDQIVLWAYRTDAGDRPIAKMLCDTESFAAKMRERMRDGGDWACGKWRRDGEQPNDCERPEWDAGKREHAGKFRWMMPRFGTITAITDNSITITPELPGFIRERMKQHDRAPDWDLPESISFAIDADTEYYARGEQVRPGAFSVGDQVLIVRRRATDAIAETDMPIAAKICDYASCRKDSPGKGRRHGCPDGDRRPRDGDKD